MFKAAIHYFHIHKIIFFQWKRKDHLVLNVYILVVSITRSEGESAGLYTGIWQINHSSGSSQYWCTREMCLHFFRWGLYLWKKRWLEMLIQNVSNAGVPKQEEPPAQRCLWSFLSLASCVVSLSLFPPRSVLSFDIFSLSSSLHSPSAQGVWAPKKSRFHSSANLMCFEAFSRVRGSKLPCSSSALNL